MDTGLNTIPLTNPSKKEIYWLIALFIFSYLIGQIYQLSAVMVEPAIRADSAKYLLTAYNLVNSGSYSYEVEAPFSSSSLLVPGYPLFLSVIQLMTGDLNKTIVLVLKIQLLMGAFVAVISTLIARRFMPFYLAIITGFIVCIYPHQVVITKYLLTESLFSFLFALAIYFMIRSLESRRGRFVFLYGLLIAFATLTRPITLLFLPFMAVIFFRSHKELSKEFILASLLTFLFWAPWSIWASNGADINESNIKQVVLYGSYPDFTYKEIRGYPNIDDPDFTPSLASWHTVYESLRSRMTQAPLRHLNWYLFGKAYSLWSFSVVQGQGGAFIYPVESSIYDLPGLYLISYRLIELLHPIISILAVISALLLTAWFFLERRNKVPSPVALVTGVITYVTLFHIPLASLPRFSIPFQCFMVILVIYILYQCCQKLREQIHVN